jgi:prepilin-type N-terminal cleavage/methylation domain-containing protein
MPTNLRRPRGFTLVEILVAMTLMVLIAAGMLRVFLQVLNTYYFDTAKLQINHDIRTFTAAMSENATYANYFKIFPAYNNLTRTVTTLVNPNDPDQGYTTAMTDTSVGDGASGDCLVLVYKDLTNDTLISRIMVYFRSPDPVTGIGPVRVMDLAVTPSSNLPLFQLIPDIPDPTIYPIIVQLSQDVATGKLFYDYHDRSIIVKGNILQRGGLLNSVHATATDTYNFTVSPRG